MAQHVQPTQTDISIPRLIGISMIARLIVDTGVKVFNPFLPLIALGLGSDVITLGRLVSLRSSMGLLAPILGALADRRGYRRILQLGLLSGAVGALVVGLSSSVLMAAVGMVFWGLSMAAFVPTLQAYLSERLPYARRARAIGVLEYSWALASIVGLYVAGQLINVAGWRAPFYMLSVGMAIMAVIMGRLPSARDAQASAGNTREGDSPPATNGQRLVDFFRLGSNARSAYATMIASTFTFFAAVQIMIIYGGWLVAEYQLDAVQLGTVALLLGVADLCGSVLVSVITDRIGKRRSVIFGNIGALVGYLLMPILNVGVVLAVLGIAIARGCFEFAIVSNLPLLSEQVPAQRGKVMTLGAALTLLASTLSGITGPWLYTSFGVQGLATASAACSVVALGILFAAVREMG